MKDLYLPGIVVAGLIFGVGFAITDYCSGTVLAAAAEGKPDAWMTIVGGLSGALTFAFLWPNLESSLPSFGGFGPVTIHGSVGINGLLVALPLNFIQPAGASLQTLLRPVELDPPQVNGVRCKTDVILPTCIGKALK